MTRAGRKMIAGAAALAIAAASCVGTSAAPGGRLGEYTEGTVNGLPACVNQNGDLHLCVRNFSDPKFITFLQEEFAVSYDLPVEQVRSLERLDISAHEISSLQGIAYFSNLTYLDCTSNYLSSLDVSELSNLAELHCANNKLETLKLGELPALKYLDCAGNQLTSLDVSKMTQLQELDCSANRLAALDVDNNLSLKFLACSENRITELDVRELFALEHLDCSANLLTELDLNHLFALKQLYCSGNKLKNLDVSNLALLEELYCGSNQLTELNLDHNAALRFVSAGPQSLKVTVEWKGDYGTVDLSKLISPESLHLVSDVKGAEYDSSTGKVTVYKDTSGFVYTIKMEHNGTGAGTTIIIMDVLVYWKDIALGDLDGNGDMDIRDVMAACRVLARKNVGLAPTFEELLRGDITGDGRVLIDDIMAICRILARGSV